MRAMEKTKDLEKLGLTKKEAVFYLSALQLGSFSIVSIAGTSGLKRPTCYLVVESLMKKGLVTAVPRARKMLYVAESPDKLKEELEEKTKIVANLIPELKKISSISKTQPLIKFYRGEQGVKSIYSDFLNYPASEIHSIFSPDQLFSVTGKEFLDDWVKKRVKNNIRALSIEIRDIKSKREYPFGTDKKLLREIKYLPADISIPGAMCAYGSNKVGFISSKKDNFSFVVTSEEYNKTIKGIFDALWKYTAVDDTYNL